jgi:transcriptional regulator with XRE-family HTH domain
MDELVLNIGKKIQYYRKKNEITLKKLADMIHATPSLISQIERGKANPSLSTLKSIADVFEIPIGLLFEYETKNQASPIIKKGTHKKIITEGNVRYSLLTPGSRDMEVIIIEFPPGSSSGERMYEHEGLECGYLLKGELSIEIEDNVFTMLPGDSISFESYKRHRMTNKGEITAVAVWANVVPWIFVNEKP